jgi:hypothetical protein
VLWVHRRALAQPVSMPNERFSSSTVHRSVEASTSGSTQRRLYRVPSLPARAHLSVGAGLPEVSSLIATSTGRVHLPWRIPSLHYVPSSGFLSLSTVCSALRFCRFVSPRSHVQGCSPVQGLLSSRSTSLLTESACPHVVQPPGARRPKPVATPEKPRLRGLPPREGALTVPRGLAATTSRSPPQVLAPSRFLRSP